MGTHGGNLTVEKIARMTIPEGRDRAVLTDAKVPGLRVELRAGGGKAYYLLRRVRGRPARIRIGDVADLTLDQARRAALAKVGVIASGGDPVAERKRVREESTLNDLFDRYLSLHLKPKRKTWRIVQGRFDLHLGAWKSRPVSSLTENAIRDLHARIGQKSGKVIANRIVEMLTAIFNFNRVEPNPAAHVERFGESSRERFLEPHEMPAFFKALAETANETMRDLFVVLLFSGQRKMTVASMKWCDVNLDTATWRIGESKAGRPVTVHLPAPAIEALLRRREATSGVYVFPQRADPSKHVTSPAPSWNDLLRRAGLRDLHVHDLRRTFGSFQAAAGSSLPIIGASLGHVSTAATSVYARLRLDSVRDSVNTAAQAMLAAAQPKPQAPAAPADDEDDAIPPT